MDTVCVLLCSSGDVHLQLLGDLARSLTDPDVRQHLRQRVGPKRLLEALTRLLGPGRSP